ncbi:MAG TPA: phosphatase PAP2 family protein [Marmoricola sp.]|nr:phosphatase PAP2 family protein [Marmoricola sp.]
MGKANFKIAGWCAVALVIAMVVVSWVKDLPIRDPDGVIVPGYIQIPAILGFAWLLDVAPRAILRARSLGGSGFRTEFAAVVSERWNRRHTVFALSGLATWYVSYAAFRNLKSYVPFVNHKIWDSKLEHIDHTLWLGHDPATVLHSLFGTTWAAELFSSVYILWIGLVPFTICIALVFTRRPAAGSWYVTSISLCWALGAIGYFLLPTLGPAYSKPSDFHYKWHSYTQDLITSLANDRKAVVPANLPGGGAHGDPHATHVLQSIAAFPSLHVGIMVTICLFLVLTRAPRWSRVSAWIFLALTVLATLYFGWHFSVDALGGVVLGTAAVWLGALATGNSVNGIPRLIERGTYEDAGADDPDQSSAEANRSA